MMLFLGLGMSAIDLRAPAIRSGAVIMLATFGISMGREWSRIGLLVPDLDPHVGESHPRETS